MRQVFDRFEAFENGNRSFFLFYGSACGSKNALGKRAELVGFEKLFEGLFVRLLSLEIGHFDLKRDIKNDGRKFF